MRATSALRDDRQLVSNLERDLRRFDPGFVQPRQSQAPDGRLRRVLSWSSALGVRAPRSPGCGAPSAFRAPATPACRSPVAAAAVPCCPLPAFSSDAASGAQKPLSQEGTSQARCSSPKEEEREPAPAAASLRVPAGADAGAALLGLPAKRGGPQGRTLAGMLGGQASPALVRGTTQVTHGLVVAVLCCRSGFGDTRSAHDARQGFEGRRADFCFASCPPIPATKPPMSGLPVLCAAKPPGCAWSPRPAARSRSAVARLSRVFAFARGGVLPCLKLSFPTFCRFVSS